MRSSRIVYSALAHQVSDILPGDKLSDLDYADDKVLLFDNFSGRSNAIR